MYRRCYSINDMPQIISRDNKEGKKNETCPNEIHKPPKQEKTSLISGGKLFGKLENDDIILIAIILILLADDCDDKILLAALAFIFISGIL